MMKLHPEEIAAARLHAAEHPAPLLSAAQIRAVRKHARLLQRESTEHPWLHNLLNLSVFAFLFAIDAAGLVVAPRWLLGSHSSAGRIALAVAIVGLLHGWCMYSIVSVSLHEGAAHGRLVIVRGASSRLLAVILGNASRLFFADPVYYRAAHVRHHAHLGTELDGAFTHSVLPRRFWTSLLPFAGTLPFNDYKIHAGSSYTRSRALSDVLGLVYGNALGAVVMQRFGVSFTMLVLVLAGPWWAFTLDRLRETIDHNLMPLDVASGTRELGPGPIAFLIAPGPWGQCCHLAHHLAPALSWYQQLRLHRTLVASLTEAQRAHFLVEGALGIPRLLVRVLRANRRYVDRVTSRTARTEGVSCIASP